MELVVTLRANDERMEKLTAKEEEIMRLLWDKGPMPVREMLEFYDEPRPHFNTVSTTVRILEEKGYVGHTPEGKSYRYHAAVGEDEFGRRTLASVVGRYFKNSYLRVVSSLVEDGNLPVDELRSLLDEIEQSKKGGDR